MEHYQFVLDLVQLSFLFFTTFLTVYTIHEILKLNFNKEIYKFIMVILLILLLFYEANNIQKIIINVHALYTYRIEFYSVEFFIIRKITLADVYIIYNLELINTDFLLGFPVAIYFLSNIYKLLDRVSTSFRASSGVISPTRCL